MKVIWSTRKLAWHISVWARRRLHCHHCSYLAWATYIHTHNNGRMEWSEGKECSRLALHQWGVFVVITGNTCLLAFVYFICGRSFISPQKLATTLSSFAKSFSLCLWHSQGNIAQIPKGNSFIINWTFGTKLSTNKERSFEFE